MADLDSRTSVSQPTELVNPGNAWVKVVLGDRRTGKSYWARHDILAREIHPNALCLMWTPNGAATDPCDIRGMVDMSAEELINARQCPPAVCLRGESPDTACEIAKHAASKFRVTLLIDEAHEVWPENFSPKSKSAELFHRGRHLGINLVAVSQWPAKLSKLLFRSATATTWFRLSAWEDLKWIERRWGEKAAREIANLKRFHSITIVGDDLPLSWRTYTDGNEDSEPESENLPASEDSSDNSGDSTGVSSDEGLSTPTYTGDWQTSAPSPR